MPEAEEVLNPDLLKEFKENYLKLDGTEDENSEFYYPIKSYREIAADEWIDNTKSFLNTTRILGSRLTTFANIFFTYKHEETASVLVSLQSLVFVNFLTFFAFRMQNVDYSPFNSSLSQMFKGLGPIGLIGGALKGIVPFFIFRNILGNGIGYSLFGAADIEVAKAFIQGREEEKVASLRPSILASAAIFLTASLIAHPFFLLGVRVQAGMLERSFASRLNNRSVFSTFSHIVQT
mmetsp:Transcript_42069/g.64488  ORF Transcript_42069/g.64488 Transcript_42069/m.64488 type:complete len:235 (-) Transcript_42069:116-820(-)|eukprot:CAMPEP_0170500592 /NCGR_PEP_ID=MMETSP0208-20121228/35366_1 /TAXON_ID=197538 /ORGANISM="Strombidium inclinatum, Strain S3" /LENGTH=234 /DNA_ID=CAMNT_0010778697 /DNA_START=670 /DNA_END=1374 /DNA_ORIENTATION=+